jgi:hypothetical protein
MQFLIPNKTFFYNGVQLITYTDCTVAKQMAVKVPHLQSHTLFKSRSSELRHREVVWQGTKVSEDLGASTFRVKLCYQFAVFWVVTPCSDVVEYQHFGGPSCSPLHVHHIEKGFK